MAFAGRRETDRRREAGSPIATTAADTLCIDATRIFFARCDIAGIDDVHIAGGAAVAAGSADGCGQVDVPCVLDAPPEAEPDGCARAAIAAAFADALREDAVRVRAPGTDVARIRHGHGLEDQVSVTVIDESTGGPTVAASAADRDRHIHRRAVGFA